MAPEFRACPSRSASCCPRPVPLVSRPRTRDDGSVSRLSTTLLSAALALPLALAGREARACKCVYGGTEVHAPDLSEALVLHEESAELRCDRGPRQHIACTWRATYRVHVEGPARTIDVAVRHVPGAGVTVSADGVVLASVPADLRVPTPYAWSADPVALRGQWSAPADADATLTVEASFLVGPWGCCDWGVNHRRHPWVTPNGRTEYFVNYRPGTPFADEPATYTLVHDMPATWRGGHGYKPPRYARTGRRRVLHSTPPRPTDGHYDEGGTFGADRPLRPVPGGPIVAAGVGWAPEGLRTRLRLGWEFAWPRLLVHSLVVETDARRRVAIVPSWELAIPDWPFPFPDLGLGLGVPVQLVPDARPGVRAQGRLGFWIFHIIGAYDHYPAVRGLPREDLGALLLQVGF
jgi:hypothetical protein